MEDPAVDSRGSLPDWYLHEEPPDDEFVRFYISAFWLLHTCRPMSVAEGPIPWTAMVQYADRMGLDRSASYIFESVIIALDGTYLTWRSKNKTT